MRVTANTFPNALLNQLTQLTVRQNRLQTQAATGQKIQLPEDNPVSMRRILDMQAEGKRIGQYDRNIDRLDEVITASYDSIKGIKTIIDRAGEIATYGDQLRNPEELQTYGVEINEIIKQAVYLANVQNRGDYIFGGTQSSSPPFEMVVSPNGDVESVTYTGNTSVPKNEISENTTITAHIVGANSSGTGSHGLITDGRSGADLFNHLISLRDNLKNGDASAVSSTNLKEISSDEENILFHIGTVGAIQSRLDTAKAVVSTRSNSLETLVSNEADADIAQTIVMLNQTQTAYMAALQSGSKILNTSLLDFIR